LNAKPVYISELVDSRYPGEGTRRVQSRGGIPESHIQENFDKRDNV
jgi:hypothetical protein